MIVTALRLVVPNTHHVICPRLRGSGVLSGDSSVSCAVGRDHSLGCIQQLPGWAGRFWKASLTGLASGCASSWLLLLAGQLENPLSTAVGRVGFSKSQRDKRQTRQAPSWGHTASLLPHHWFRDGPRSCPDSREGGRDPSFHCGVARPPYGRACEMAANCHRLRKQIYLSPPCWPR